MAKNEANKENKHFFKDFKAEIKKVIWLTPKQLVNNTTAVIVMVLIVAVIVFVLDLAFDAFNKYALTGLQEVVQSRTVDEELDSGDNVDANSTESSDSTDATADVTETTTDADNTTEDTSEAN